MLSSHGDQSPSRLQRPPPEAWPRARRAIERLITPVDRFLRVEAASGILLLVASALALVLANSRWGGAYEQLWHTTIRIGIGPLTFENTLHFVINDGLMVLFFFVVGLEVRRELYEGELAELRRASLPVAAALGGMLAPAVIYFTLNRGAPAQGGWGVPMATDIAFGVGLLALMGKRVPPSARVLLLALAVIDDIGAILVIAVFYSSHLSLVGFAIASAAALVVLVMRGLGVRRAAGYIAPGVVMWAGFLKAGVHPTIAGVLLGLMTPARAWYGEQDFVRIASRILGRFRDKDEPHPPDDLVHSLSDLGEARREALPPAMRLEHYLHPWVSFGILPLFAFANAGVNLAGVDPGADGAPAVFAGVALGLLAGKPLGILIACFVAVKLGLASLPSGLDWKGVGLIGVVAAIGFTMAIFIAGLALEQAMLPVAKLAIVTASVTAGIAALLLGRVVFSNPPAPGAATCEESERSTEA